MKKTKYIFNGGIMTRKDNTLKFQPIDAEGVLKKPHYLPIQDISDLYCFGNITVNSALLNFLGQQQVALHFFDYYENYTGSFMPRDKQLAGKMQVAQTQAYLQNPIRLYLAQQLIQGATNNMLYILNAYRKKDRNLIHQVEAIKNLQPQIATTDSISELMGIEGNCRQVYYTAFDSIISSKDLVMNGRSKQPPKNEINALISFGNTMCYTLCLRAIHNTALNPTISFLHEPGARRYSLALDIAEIFKPALVDRTIFTLLNRKQIQQHKHFEPHLNGVYLNDVGKRIFLEAYEARLKETFLHPKLKKKVSYRHAVRLECYKFVNYIMKTADSYQPFVLGRHAR